jgi:hypothetical protein
LGVEPVAGRLRWEWATNMKATMLGPAMTSWKAAGVDAVVLDNAPGHRSATLKSVAPTLVPLPPYSPELDPAERVFRALRAVMEGEVYTSLDDMRAKAEAWLRELAADPARVRSLTAWDWLVPQVTVVAARPAPRVNSGTSDGWIGIRGYSSSSVMTIWAPWISPALSWAARLKVELEPSPSMLPMAMALKSEAEAAAL